MASKSTPNKSTKTTNNKKVAQEKRSFLQLMLGDQLLGILKSEKFHSAIGFVLIAVALLLVVAMISYVRNGYIDLSNIESGTLEQPKNACGVWGAEIAHYLMQKCYGFSAFFIPVYIALIGLRLTRSYQFKLLQTFIHCTLLMVWSSVMLSILACHVFPEGMFYTLTFYLGGEHGEHVRGMLEKQMGVTGAFVVCITLALCYIVYVSSKALEVIRTCLNPSSFVKEHMPKRKPKEEGEEPEVEGEEPIEPDLQEVQTESGPLTVDLTTGEVVAINEEPVETEESVDTEDEVAESEGDIAAPTDSEEEADETPQLAITEFLTPQKTDDDFIIEEGVHEEEADGSTVEEMKIQGPYDPKKDLEFYKYPLISLLKKHADADLMQNDTELKANKDRITEVLKNFGVEISSIKATIGPTITLYEITPAPGVKIARIRNLEDDIALNLSAIGVRIIAPIPGKGTIGIEVPNQHPLIVSMESIINSKKFQDTTFELPIALGKTITNEVFMVDLAKMPHLLVAGATGQGKSVGLNAIITSLLYKKHPAELKIVMVDPKKVEFSIYAPIENHFLAKIPGEGDPIITDVTKVIQTLNSLCQEMDTRYDLLKKARVRNIKEYNAKFIDRQLNPEHGHHYMPYIVVVIDEFGDLIMTAGKEVELPIARIAQLARAVGMHMIIATQRPTTNIITGTIKANFPARMAFKVMSQIDSRTILDGKGADQLVGKGDMLFLAGNTPTRVQCAFVDTPEVEQICQHIACQQSYVSAFELPEPAMEETGGGGSSEGFDSDSLDPMFAEAAREIVSTQQGSTSLIQRRFKIGYNRAGRLMDQMEKVGIVGPTRGAKPREVYCADLAELEVKLNSL